MNRANLLNGKVIEGGQERERERRESRYQAREDCDAEEGEKGSEISPTARYRFGAADSGRTSPDNTDAVSGEV